MSKDKFADNDIPAGFDTRVGRERGDGWLKKEPGVVIQGRLLGRYTMKGQVSDDGTARTYLQVKLSDGSGIKGKDGKIVAGVPASQLDPTTREKLEVRLQPGQVINIDEHTALEDLAPWATDGGVHDVWFMYVSQDKVQGTNRTFWVVKGPAIHTVRAGRPHVQQAAPAAKPVETEIPF